MTKNKFINNSGSTGSPGSTGSAILKFIVLVGLILGVCAFVLVLTTKCKCKAKFTATDCPGKCMEILSTSPCGSKYTTGSERARCHAEYEKCCGES